MSRAQVRDCCILPLHHSSAPWKLLTVEGEGEASSPRQAGVLGVPPGADRGGEQWGSLSLALLLVPEAEEAIRLATQQEVVLAIAQMELPGMAVPVEAEVVEAPGLRKRPGGLGGCLEGGMDREGLLGVPDGDVQLRCLLVVEEAPLCLIPLAAEAEVFPGATTVGTWGGRGCRSARDMGGSVTLAEKSCTQSLGLTHVLRTYTSKDLQKRVSVLLKNYWFQNRETK